MPGVIRPYTLTDVLATINQAAQGGSVTTGLSATVFSVISEATESIPSTAMADSATTSAAVPTAWDQGQWGATQWQ